MTAKEAATIYDVEIDAKELQGMITRRSNAAKSHWEKEFKLDDVRKKNDDLYLTKYAENGGDEAMFADNRIFQNVRTIIPIMTGRIAEVEIVPGGTNDEAVQFARDFEVLINKKAIDTKARAHIKLVVQDLLRGKRVGWIKFSQGDKGLKVEHVAPEDILVDGDTGQLDEPEFIQQKVEMRLSEALVKFPHKRTELLAYWGVSTEDPDTNLSYENLEQVEKLHENWFFIDDHDGSRRLVTVWSMARDDAVIDGQYDELFDDNGLNIAEDVMLPYVWYNFLNDGNSKIDETSFLEQSQYSQKNYERTGQAIVDNAAYGGSGVPVVASGAMESGEVAQIKFDPSQRITLDVSKLGNDVNKAFTTWKSDPVRREVVEDKYDSRNNVDATFGTSSLLRANEASSPTLGQDRLIQDNTEGRLSEPIDCVETAMDRFYKLEAQFLFRFATEEEYFRYKGKDGKLQEIYMTDAKMRKNAGISVMVSTGSTVAPGRGQRRQTVIELLKMKAAPLLEAYKTLGVFDDPEKAYKDWLTDQIDPATALAEAEKDRFDRMAANDLELAIAGKVPDEREDITPEYVTYLNDYLQTDKYRTQLTPKQQAFVSAWIQTILGKAQLKVAKMAATEPTGEDQNAPHVSQDQRITLNAADLLPSEIGQLLQSQGITPDPSRGKPLAAGSPSSDQEPAGQPNEAVEPPEPSAAIQEVVS